MLHLTLGSNWDKGAQDSHGADGTQYTHLIKTECWRDTCPQYDADRFLKVYFMYKKALLKKTGILNRVKVKVCEVCFGESQLWEVSAAKAVSQWWGHHIDSLKHGSQMYNRKLNTHKKNVWFPGFGATLCDAF